jgi:hypothetical protein
LRIAIFPSGGIKYTMMIQENLLGNLSNGPVRIKEQLGSGGTQYAINRILEFAE